MSCSSGGGGGEGSRGGEGVGQDGGSSDHPTDDQHNHGDPAYTDWATSRDGVITLPTQLESIRRVADFPLERHRWNTNEEVAAILISFERHAGWEKRDVLTRPPSGTMLLYSRSKARYRKDGYCWKKRKDGKTTREDHMKLKVHGIECIYGCYVHSAILPTFHRRCYWLLQNPDIVLVHYLNVPMNDDNKLCLPAMTLQLDSQPWTRDDLISQLTPMFASLKHVDQSNNIENADEFIESLTQHLMSSTTTDSPHSISSSTATSQLRFDMGGILNVMNGGGRGTTGGTDDLMLSAPPSITSPPSSQHVMHSRLLQLIYSYQMHAAFSDSQNKMADSKNSTGGSLSGNNLTRPVSTVQQTSPVDNNQGTKSRSRVTCGLPARHRTVGPSRQRQNRPVSAALGAPPPPLPLPPPPRDRSAAVAAAGSGAIVERGPGASVLSRRESAGSGVSKEERDEDGGCNISGSLSTLDYEGGCDNVNDNQRVDIVSECNSDSGGMFNFTPFVSVGETPANHTLFADFPDSKRDIYAMLCRTDQGPGSIKIDKTASDCGDRTPANVRMIFTDNFTAVDCSETEHVSGGGGLGKGGRKLDMLMGGGGDSYRLEAICPCGDSDCDRSCEYSLQSSALESTDQSSSLSSLRTTNYCKQEPFGFDDNNDEHASQERCEDDDEDETMYNDDLDDIFHVVSLASHDDLHLTEDFRSDGGMSLVGPASKLLLSSPPDIRGLRGEGGEGVGGGGRVGDGEGVGGGVELVDITDFCPEWSYSEGGTKVLVTGPWVHSDSEYSVRFGDCDVSTTMVQTGVLRCYAPPHSAAFVCLCVLHAGRVISAPQMFEYRTRSTTGPTPLSPPPTKTSLRTLLTPPSSSSLDTDHIMATFNNISDDEMRRRLISRLLSIQRDCLGSTGGVLSDESSMVEIVDQWSYDPSWNTSYITNNSSSNSVSTSDQQLSLLHFSAALGYNGLVSALIRLSCDCDCELIKKEVDSLVVDSFGNTPLMWACARGHTDTALILYNWSPTSLNMPNSMGFNPLTILHLLGHATTAKRLEHAQLSTCSTHNPVGPSNSFHPGIPSTNDLKAKLDSSATSGFETNKTSIHHPSVSANQFKTFRDQANKNDVDQFVSTELSVTSTRSKGRDSSGAPVNVFEPSGAFLSRLPPDGRSIPAAAKTRKQTDRLSFRSFSVESDALYAHGRGDSSPSSAVDSPACRRASPSGNNRTTAATTASIGNNRKQRMRLLKRTSVDFLPDYPQFTDLNKLSKTDSGGGSNGGVVGGGGSDKDDSGESGEGEGGECGRSDGGGMLKSGDPMISQIDRDLNSPVMFLNHGSSFDTSSCSDRDLCLDDVISETTAMDMDPSNHLDADMDGFLQDDSSSTILIQALSVGSSDFTHSNQMITLANQIIAAMPERIKLSPSHSKHLLMDEINARRSRASSSAYSSFSSASATPPPCCSSTVSSTAIATMSSTTTVPEDSGISTPRDGLSFLEYRYSDLGTPSSSTLSPTSTCVQSPYSFGIDSPPPTAEEFTEYFNAPATYMEKDFSQLTLSDEEQRRLYEAAKIIQSFYRKYKDKLDYQLRQQQKEIEAAILIQSYYRRYKQFVYYKRMTQAAVLIQSQFRSYYAQKRFRRSREAATIIQNRYRAYKQHERYKKSRSAAVIIQQRFRSHYQRIHGKQTTLANSVHKMITHSDHKLDTDAMEDCDVRSNSEQSIFEALPAATSSCESGGPRRQSDTAILEQQQRIFEKNLWRDAAGVEELLKSPGEKQASFSDVVLTNNSSENTDGNFCFRHRLSIDQLSALAKESINESQGSLQQYPGKSQQSHDHGAV